MIRKGYKLRRNRHLTWRNADGEHDQRVDGKVIPDNYVVIVRKKNCPVTKTEVNRYGEEVDYISPKGVEHLPVKYHSRTNFIFGPKKKHECINYVEYYPIYWVEDGMVYQGRAYIEEEKE